MKGSITESENCHIKRLVTISGHKCRQKEGLSREGRGRDGALDAPMRIEKARSYVWECVHVNHRPFMEYPFLLEETNLISSHNIVALKWLLYKRFYPVSGYGLCCDVCRLNEKWWLNGIGLNGQMGLHTLAKFVGQISQAGRHTQHTYRSTLP